MVACIDGCISSCLIGCIAHYNGCLIGCTTHYNGCLIACITHYKVGSSRGLCCLIIVLVSVVEWLHGWNEWMHGCMFV